MDFKSNKPLIIISGALTLAIIVIAIQLVFLSITVKAQKDSLHTYSTATDVHTMQNRMVNMENNLLDMSRQLETLRADYGRLNAEVSAMQNVVGKTGNDYQFLQQELTNFDNRIGNLERNAANTEYVIQSMERSIRNRQH